MPRFYKLNAIDAMRMARYYPRSVYNIKTENPTIHEDWITEDFPRSPVIESWNIIDDTVSIIWKESHSNYRPIKGEFISNTYNDRASVEYSPARQLLYVDGKTYEGKYLEDYLIQMEKVVDLWKRTKI
jgi:hypothetical protein